MAERPRARFTTGLFRLTAVLLLPPPKCVRLPAAGCVLPWGAVELRFQFEDYVLDTDRRELRRGTELVPVAPRVFDLLDCLIRNRERVVSKDDLISAVWDGRIVSDSALTTRINAARRAIGDSGEKQRLIKTLPH